MSNFSATRKLAMALALVLGLGGVGDSMVAAQESNSTFACGKNLYNSKMYKDALRYFKVSEKERPDDNRAFYFEALSYHKMGQLQSAMSAYQNVIAKFPESEAADLSRSALKSFGVSYNAEAIGGSLTKTNALRVDQVPVNMSLKAGDADGKPVVEVLVSGAKVKFTIDTSHSDTIVGADIFKNSRMRPGTVVTRNEPAKPAVKEAAKVDVKKDKSDVKAAAATSAPAVNDKTDKTDGGSIAKVESKPVEKPAQEDLTYLYEIKLGDMVRTSFPVTISSKNPTEAILGADFFGGANLAYDKKAGTVTIKRAATYKNSFETALKAYNTGNFAQAYPLLKKTVADRPNDPRALYLLAVSSHRAGKISEARARYRSLMQRFPSTEAAVLANTALVKMDPPSTSSGASEYRRGDVTGMIGTVPKDDKNRTFEVPYVAENRQFKVNALVDGHTTEMYLISSLAEHQFSSDQLRLVDPTYLDQNSDVTVQAVDPNNSNNLSVTATRTITIRRLQLGPVALINTPAKIIDINGRTGITWSTSERPYLAGAAIQAQGWKYEAIPQRRMLKFTKLQ